MKKILVTGGGGFIGSHLLKRLGDVDYTGNENIVSGQYLPFLDFSNISYEAVIHLAAINETQLLDRQKIFDFNYEISKKLLLAAAAGGCKRFIYASSQAVYGNSELPYKESGSVDPLTPYAESKLAFDNFCLGFSSEMLIIGLRFSNVYGENEGHKGKRASMIYQMINSERPCLFWDGNQSRDWVYVEDVVTAILTCLEINKSGVYNIGSGVGVSFNKILKIIKKESMVRYIENPYRGTYQNHTLCCIDKARKDLGYVPSYDIESGIFRIINK